MFGLIRIQVPSDHWVAMYAAFVMLEHKRFMVVLGMSVAGKTITM